MRVSYGHFILCFLVAQCLSVSLPFVSVWCFNLEVVYDSFPLFLFCNVISVLNSFEWLPLVYVREISYTIVVFLQHASYLHAPLQIRTFTSSPFTVLLSQIVPIYAVS